MKRRHSWLETLIFVVLTLIFTSLVDPVVYLLQKNPIDLSAVFGPAIFIAVGVAGMLTSLIARAFFQPEQRADDEHHKILVESWRRKRSAFGTQKRTSIWLVLN